MELATHFDEDYLKAIKDGDSHLARVIIAEAAAQAGFTAGPFYHGVGPEGTFNEFDAERIGSTSGNYGHAGGVFYFAHEFGDAQAYSIAYGGTGEVIPVYLRIKKALEPEQWQGFLHRHPEIWEQRVKVTGVHEGWLREQLVHDAVALCLFDAIKIKGYEEGFAMFMDIYSPKDSAYDLNDVADLADPEYDYWKAELCRTMFHAEPILTTELIYPSIVEVTSLGQNVVALNDALRSEGYDAVMMNGEIAVFEASQIRCSEVVVIDDDKRIIPPSVRFSGTGNDIRGDIQSMREKAGVAV
jgi:hypothetical protein